MGGIAGCPSRRRLPSWLGSREREIRLALGFASNYDEINRFLIYVPSFSGAHCPPERRARLSVQPTDVNEREVIVMSIAAQESTPVVDLSSLARRWLWMPLVAECLIFCLVSGLDYMLTQHLLLGAGNLSRAGHMVEANPVARYFLYSWGFQGLICFKACSVAMVVMICQIIAHKRVDVARRLMMFAIVAVLVVVLHSVRLIVAHA